jgi:hypothetical protein
LEPGWNSWNIFLNEYGKVLLEYGANFTYVIFDDNHLVYDMTVEIGFIGIKKK